VFAIIFAIPVRWAQPFPEWSHMFLARPYNRSAKTPRRPRILAQIALLVFAIPATVTGQAQAQAIAYTVRIEAPRPLVKLLEENLDLVRWRGNPRLDLAQLQRLVKGAPEQARTLVATEGYYGADVQCELDTTGAEPVARIRLDPGAPVLVGELDLVLHGFAAPAADAGIDQASALRAHWSLAPGQPFRHADWELAKRQLLREVLARRYPRAQLIESSATIDPLAHRALLRVVLESGPDVRFDGLRIEGLQRYPATIVTNLNLIKPGEPYDEAALQALQARLQDTGYFSGVDVVADIAEAAGERAAPDTPDAPGAARAPATPISTAVLVRVTENKKKNVTAGLGYSTNTGNRAQLSYDNLNVGGLRMKNNLVVETKRQSARTDFYFPTSVEGHNDSLGAGFERNDLHGEVTAVTSLAARRAWGAPRLERSVGIELVHERRSVGPLSTTSKSVPLTYSLTKRALDNLLAPTDGYVINAQFGGALLPLLTDERFLRAYSRFVRYRPLGASGTLVLRAEAGALASRQKPGVPDTYLFRAGGDGSVRGYGYQRLGVADGAAIVGGRYLLTASAEYDYWFKPPWGVAVFYDAGNAADTLKELKPKAGYGIGARWRSPVGPINIDLAYGQAVRKARLHFSLGFTF
jgi:translocation and assembly module TamA